MAGTASEFYEHSEGSNHDICNLDSFSNWLFVRINTACSLDDINHRGCSILIPHDAVAIPEIFSLLITFQQDDHKLQSVITGQQRWIDDDFSASHKKMGIRFTDIDDQQRCEIDDITMLLRRPGQNTIRCGILKK